MIECFTLLILILGFVVAALTFLHAYRPYVGVEKISRSDIHKGDGLEIKLTPSIVNAGNVPAYSVQTRVKMLAREKLVSESSMDSSFILLPGMVSSGESTFNLKGNLENINNLDLKIEILIRYQATPLLFNYLKRQFECVALFKIDGDKPLATDIKERWIGFN